LSGKETYSILVVDDERSMREFLEILLTKEGYQVSLAASGEEAFKVLENNPLISPSRISGCRTLTDRCSEEGQSLNPESVVIMISAFATAETGRGGHEGRRLRLYS